MEEKGRCYISEESCKASSHEGRCSSSPGTPGHTISNLENARATKPRNSFTSDFHKVSQPPLLISGSSLRVMVVGTPCCSHTLRSSAS